VIAFHHHDISNQIYICLSDARFANCDFSMTLQVADLCLNSFSFFSVLVFNPRVSIHSDSVFCDHCLRTSMSLRPECPNDRRPAHPDDIVACGFANRLIREMKV
jgi:hypothetical protein